MRRCNTAQRTHKQGGGELSRNATPCLQHACCCLCTPLTTKAGENKGQKATYEQTGKWVGVDMEHLLVLATN